MNQLKTDIKQNPTVECNINKISADNLLKDSHLKYKIIADFTFDIEICRDNNGKVIYVSPAFERITSYSCDDYMSGKLEPLEIVHPDDREIFKGYLSKILPSNDIMCSIEDSMNPVVNDPMSILNNPSLEVTLNEK